MIGKKNVVFGFLYLVLTAALGPYMVTQFGTVATAEGARQKALAALQGMAASGFTDPTTLETLTPAQLARINARALLAVNDALTARAPIDAIKGGPHTHGNLESLLNIAVGLTLCFTAGAVWLRQLVSWAFIAGALLHSGMLYLGIVFQFAWARTVLDTGIGPALILAGLLLAGIATAIGLRGEPVRDA